MQSNNIKIVKILMRNH